MAGTTTRSWAYSYDPADRLTQALASPDGTYAYSLDAADNLLEQQSPTGTASSTYNVLNQLLQRSGQPFTHDAAGNLTGDGTRSYAWDAEQRLVRIGYTGTDRSTTFRYDAFGRRTAVIEQDGTTATETRYLWCGERLCQARDATDTVTRRYYDEGELAVAATGDVAAFYAEDHLGSVRDLRLGDGQVLASYDYDPYGVPSRVSETSGIHADYRYAGLVNHAPSGLYLAHYRAYSPQTGRWLSRDPIGEAGGVNLYGYVENGSINAIDPTGLVKLYGSWCGPNWSGGFRKPYDKMDATERSVALPPVDKLDQCCRAHDITYADCRAKYPCDAKARQQCFQEADRGLSNCSSGAGGGQSPMILLFGNPQKRIEDYMKSSNPGAGPNAGE